MRPSSEADILVANTSAVFTDKGQTFKIVKGKTTARRGAKILRGREHLFAPLVIDFDAAVDTPKRGPGRPKKEDTSATESTLKEVVKVSS